MTKPLFWVPAASPVVAGIQRSPAFSPHPFATGFGFDAAAVTVKSRPGSHLTAPAVYSSNRASLQMRPAAVLLGMPVQFPATIQCQGNVIQPSWWDYAGYGTDVLAMISVAAQIAGAIALAAGAASWGWLVPFALPACTTLATDLLKAEAKEQGQDQALKQKSGRLAAYEGPIAKFVTTVTLAVLSMAKTTGTWGGWGAVIAAVTTIIQIVLEYVRVRNVDRDTVYGWVKRKVDECRAGEQQPLLASNQV